MTFWQLSLAIFLALSLDRWIALAVNVHLSRRAKEQMYREIEQMISSKQEIMAGRDLANLKNLRTH